MDRRTKSIILVASVLIITWAPIFIQKPLPEDVIPVEIMLDSDILYPEIEGYYVQKENVPGTVPGYRVISAREYLDKDSATWILFLKSKNKTVVLHGQEACYRVTGWDIIDSESVEVRGKEVREFLVERDGKRRWVCYWYFLVYRKQPKFFFYLPAFDHGFLVRISTTETPNEEEAKQRLNLFADKEMEVMERLSEMYTK